MRFSLFISTLIAILLSGCTKENRCDCVKSTGSANIIYRDITDFNCIEIKDKINVFLTQGNKFEVRVEAGRNLQHLIKTERDGETLRVFNTNRCNWVRGYKHEINVYITAPYFKHIMHRGVGPIKSLNTIVQDTLTCKTSNSGEIRLDINANAVLCSAHGNGDIYLTGITGALHNDYTGTNYLYANDLKVTNYIYLHSVSIGHAYVKAPLNGLMDIQIERDGNIFYSGEPGTINLVKSGKGELIKQ